jgi:hypothetical protein
MAEKIVQLKDNQTSDILKPVPAIATTNRIGGVMPVAKTDGMIVPVGMDATGKLFTTSHDIDLDPNGAIVDGVTGYKVQVGDGLIIESNRLSAVIGYEEVTV